jgi:flagellar protein FliS
MNSNPYLGQFEQQVLCADPVDLVALLFDHLVLKINQAREHLRTGDRAARAAAISSALAIISELVHSLNPEQGGEIAANLRKLYAFAAGRLTQAQIRESDRALEEALGAMLPLREAWHEVQLSRAAALADAANSGAAQQGGFAVHA